MARRRANRIGRQCRHHETSTDAAPAIQTVRITHGRMENGRADEAWAAIVATTGVSTPSMTNETAGCMSAGGVLHCRASPRLTSTDSGTTHFSDAATHSQ